MSFTTEILDKFLHYIDHEMTDEEFDRYCDIGERAADAFSTARQKHLDAGQSVRETGDDEIIWDVFPDGSKKFVKVAEPWLSVIKGTRIEIK